MLTVVYGPQKKPLDFGGNPNRVTPRLGYGNGATSYSAWEDVLFCICLIIRVLVSFVTSAALAEVCTLLSGILV